MENRQPQTIYAKPIRTSLLLLAYSLGWLGVFIIFVLIDGSGECSGLLMILPILGILLTTVVLFIVGVVIVWRYIKRIQYLRSRQLKVPRSYIAVFVMLPIALAALFWIFPIAMEVNAQTASAKMNTLDEFHALAEDCKVDEVGYYYNDYHHRADDANAYIIVRTTNYNTLFYSYTQKEVLRRTYQTYSEKCAAQSQGADGINIYKEVWWNGDIISFSASC